MVPHGRWVSISLICLVLCVVSGTALFTHNSQKHCNDEPIINSLTRAMMRLETLINNKMENVTARLNEIDRTMANIQTDIKVIKKDTQEISGELEATNGGWSLWTPWTDCSTTCGKGQKTRSRKCDSPEPSPCGRPCNGDDHETEICNQKVCPIDGCLATDGFFKLPGSHYCYKVMNDTKLSWEEGQERCTSEGYQLAEPPHDITLKLRKELQIKYGDGMMWIGGKGNGHHIIWQNSQAEVSKENSLWLASNNVDNVGTEHCLILLVIKRYMDTSPTEAYYTTQCSSKRKTLCEVISR